MDIPRDFKELTQQQLVEFARIGFDTFWDLVDRLKASKELNSTAQRIRKEVIEMQKVINKQNQELV